MPESPMDKQFHKVSHASLPWNSSKTNADFIVTACNSFYQNQKTIKVLTEALESIASYDDEVGNAHLDIFGSYSAFDEACSVETARKALSKLKKG